MKNILLILGTTLLLLFSCKHELERPTWDVDMIAPLAHSQMNIDNMLSDSNLIINENEEGFISLIYEQDLINVNYDSLITLETKSEEKSIRIDSVNFNDIVIEEITTLGSLINQIPFGTLIYPNGSQQVIPSLTGIAPRDTIPIDASEYFETMTLYNGMLNLKLTNGFPTDISNVSFSLYNTTNLNLIATFSIPLIESGDTYAESVSIAGKTLDHIMFGIINNMDIEASAGEVNINYTDLITTKISITEIKIKEATAYFPNQLLHEEKVEQSFELGSARLTEIGIKEGTVTINAISTLPDTGTIIYAIPSLSKNGILFETSVKIPPNNNGMMTQFIFDFNGYTMDLTGKNDREGGDTVNTIYATLRAYLDSTGELETIQQIDSFFLFNEYNFTPEYAIGYIGQDTIEFGPETKELTLFNKVNADVFDLEKADLKIKFENFIGADATIQINDFSTSNANTSVLASIDQNGNTIISHNYSIDRASLSGNGLPINQTVTEIIIDADEMLEILPDKVTTQASFYLNPNGQAITDDFLYPDYPIKASISMEIPLSFIAKNLILTDTTEISISNQEDLEIDKLFISIKNGLPLDANLKLVLLDNQSLVIDTLLAGTTILGASIDENNLISQINTTSIQMDYTNFINAKKLISIASFNSTPINKFISIYNDYTIDIKLSAKFKQTIGN